ncbi:hypothetical protein ZIOFF_021539 [Zingiber officinale]|uniref:Uncharacterized protein n=1 Tax=Zingiber officinale TaxID=94328 RepID=A0A8J5H9X5_ZINOF|nr:hypothetical protein ZIOFF_021539 [Zingiber officinale]
MLKLYGIPYLILSHICITADTREAFLIMDGLTTSTMITHVIHLLFPQIRHYHLVEATEAAQPVLGKYYREPEQSGPLPLHLFGALSRSLNHMITLYLILETSCIIKQMINHAVLQKWSHDLAGEKLS